MKKTLVAATCALLAAGLALTGCKEKKAEKTLFMFISYVS